jgi:hypothetical protein
MIVNKTFRAPRSLPFSDWNNWIFVKNSIFECSEQINCITIDKDRKLRFDQLHQSFSLLKEIMSMWRNRGRPPHSAELTFQILGVMYRDVTGHPRMLHVSEYEFLRKPNRIRDTFLNL